MEGLLELLGGFYGLLTAIAFVLMFIGSIIMIAKANVLTTIGTRGMVVVAMLIALNIALGQIASFMPNETLRLGISFITLAVTAMLYGPWVAGIAGAIGDVVGFIMFPPPFGGFFIGFTLTAFTAGVLWGIFLHNRKTNIWRIIMACIATTIICNMLFNTLWLIIIIPNRTFMAMLAGRYITQLIMLPVKIVLTTLVSFAVVDRVRHRVIKID